MNESACCAGGECTRVVLWERLNADNETGNNIIVIAVPQNYI